jgi:hypothetical protein
MKELDMPDPATGLNRNDHENPSEDERPRRDKDLFDISLWWLPLILAAVVIVLLLAEKTGLFGV